MRRAKVLLITRTGVPVGRVQQRLAQYGIDAAVLHSDQLGNGVSLAHTPGSRLTLRSADIAVDLSELQAIWYRRISLQAHLADGTPVEIQRAVLHEQRSLLHGLLAAHDGYVLTHKHQLAHADKKPRQLTLAHAAGLRTPRTLTTTSASEARAFLGSLPTGGVTKVLTSFQVLHEGQNKVVMTTRMTPEAIAEIDDLSLCPTTFQEAIVRGKEVRVTLVGDRIFAAGVDAAHLDAAETDWRRAGRDIYRHWKPIDLPSDVRAGLQRLMDRLCLDYGAADFMVTPEGRWVFLEVNPAGEYLWQDELFDGAISTAIADLLCGRQQRRVHAA